MWLALFLNISYADVSTSTPELKRAILTNPFLPYLGVVASGLVSQTEFEDFIKLRFWDANLRGIHLIDDRWGVMAQVDLSRSVFFVSTTHLGVRAGPRIALQEQGLSDWTCTPFVLGGVTTNTAGLYSLSRWGVIGAGGEVGRTVEWNQIVIDLSVGAYTTKNIGYKAQAEGLANASKPDELLAIKPSLQLGFGYAF